jgi:hypothetical protein
MTSLLLFLLAGVGLALSAVRPDITTPEAAPTPRQAATAMRAAGLRRVAWLAFQAVTGVALALLIAALRTGLYLALLAVSKGASRLASAVALERAQIYRLEIHS